MTIKHLTPNRFDIPAKTLYARLRNLDTDWGEWVYSHHLKVWNGYHEREPEKTCLEDFLKCFEQILDDVKNDNFDFQRSPIPISNTGELLNGAHRYAAALIHNCPVEIVENNRAPHLWNHEFFTNKTDIIPTGLLPAAADAMALEYCRLRSENRDLYIVSVFPSALGQEDEVCKILNRHGIIAYHKEVHLTENGFNHLIQQFYETEPWVGSVADRFKGARRKAEKCFTKKGPVRVYLIQSPQQENMVTAKQEIRDLFNISNHSVHINDTFEETMHIGNLVFNENSIDFLNAATFRPSFSKFWNLLTECREAPASSEICIGGSAAMAAHGLRDTGDFDYLHAKKFPHMELAPKITSHGEWVRFYHTSPEDIVFNPTNYFYFSGIKFATLDVVREMKIIRWEKKDRRDIEMINAHQNQAPPKPIPLRPIARGASFLKKLWRR